jgi:hypothetical protein
LVLVPLDEALSKLDKMLDLKNRIASTDQKCHRYLSTVGNLARGFLVEYHDHLQKHPMKCRALTQASLGGGTYRKDAKTGESTRSLKIRLREQLPIREAGLLSTSVECMALMKLPRFKSIFDKAVALNPPSLQCFPGNEKADQIAALQFVEMAQAVQHSAEIRGVLAAGQGPRGANQRWHGRQ